MKLNRIFQAVEETRFLKQLSLQDRLFLVGEAAPLEYIQGFFERCQNDRNYYRVVSGNEPLARDIQDLKSYRAIVVVSVEDEAALWSKVKQQVASLDIDLPVLRLFGDIFINLLCQKPLLESISDRTTKPNLAYAIVTTPRSGSTYLCDLLCSTNVAGYPSEHLRLAAQELALYCNFDYLKLLDNLMEYRITDNGVFGTKFISHFLFEFRKTKPNFRQIFRSLDKFVLLIRQDKLAQAVSLELAQKTEIWHLNGNSKNTEYQSKLAEVEIDDSLLDNVEQKYNFICEQEAHLKKVLANNKIEPLEVLYEDILEDARAQVTRILEFLEIANPEAYVTQINSGIKKMPSNISLEIMDRYQKRKSTACET